MDDIVILWLIPNADKFMGRPGTVMEHQIDQTSAFIQSWNLYCNNPVEATASRVLVIIPHKRRVALNLMSLWSCGSNNTGNRDYRVVEVV